MLTAQNNASINASDVFAGATFQYGIGSRTKFVRIGEEILEDSQMYRVYVSDSPLSILLVSEILKKAKNQKWKRT